MSNDVGSTGNFLEHFEVHSLIKIKRLMKAENFPKNTPHYK